MDGGGGVASASGGDWLCGDASCANVNFARRVACNRCGRRRQTSSSGSGTEIGKSAADKSRGLFTADDWQCGKCANVNWARRLTCNVCNAPKFGEVEARTGYGGGYNERGVVEYRQRHDSDDEYDEFGRLKKRKAKESASKVCGNRRHLDISSDISDGSVTPQQHRSRLTQHLPTESVHHELDIYGSSVCKRDSTVSPRKRRKRSSTFSTDRHVEKDLSLEENDSVRNSSKERNSYQNKNLNNHKEYDKKQFHNDCSDNFKYKSYQRDCIMENRVSSTNDIKYRFKGKTVDDNFEVTYTLQERIKAAAWAISYHNCKVSAEKFQIVFDKPAPDFKTIFSWRQRLLNSGCLVDGHLNIDIQIKETSGKQIKKRKRRRYFKSVSKDIENSDVDINNPKSRFTTKEISSKIDDCNSDDCDMAIKNIDKSEDDSNIENKRLSISCNNNTCNSAARSSTSEAKCSFPVGSKHSYCSITENSRSETPEIIAARTKLAQSKSPNRVETPETHFQDDNYFNEKSENLNQIADKPMTLKPEISKHKATEKIKVPEEISKSMLEDIVSESERYSSDGHVFGSDDNDSNDSSDLKNNGNKNDIKSTDNVLKQQPDNVYNPRIVENSTTNFGQQKLRTLCSNTLQSNVNEDQDNAKSYGPAMRRIMESMSNQTQEKSSENIEYIPTKIDPIMAKRNHSLFKNIHDIWSNTNNSFVDVSKEKKSQKKCDKIDIEVSKMIIDDYVPDDDALYRIELSEHDEGLQTPPRAPNIGSISSKNIPSETNINPLDKVNSLFQINLSSINTDDLALALKNIQNISLSLNNSVELEKMEKDNSIGIPVKKNDHIPFLEDMFYPGSPDKNKKTNEKNKIDESTKQDLILDGTTEHVSKNLTGVSGFKSFAIPKPIMLNRLRNQQSQNTRSMICAEAIEGNKIKKKRIKKKSNEDNGYDKKDDSSRLYDNEEEEESGEEADLSKYDLWGSDQENEKKGENVSNENKDNFVVDKDNEKDYEEVKKSDFTKKQKSKSPTNVQKRSRSEGSPSGSSGRSSSSSSSSASSSAKAPRNREHSRAGSKDSSRSRSPIYDRTKEREKRRSRSRDKTKEKLRDNRNKDRNLKRKDTNKDKGRDRDKGRERDRDRQRHHYGGTRSNHGGYSRGRAR